MDVDEPIKFKDGKLEMTSMTVEEDNVVLDLNIIFAKKFGGDIDNSKVEEPLVEYINEQFEHYLDMEWSVPRRLDENDPRVHLCIYMLTPTGHSIRSVDLVTMKALAQKVNLVPVIAKADSVTKDTIEDFKDRIMDDLEANEVEIYEFPMDDEDSDVKDRNEEFQAELPFAVAGSKTEIEINGKKVRARQYPWGLVEVENDDHCQFNLLRAAVIRNNMEALISSTHTAHFHKYRQDKLKKLGYIDNAEDEEAMPIVDSLRTKLKKDAEDFKQMHASLVASVAEKVGKAEAEQGLKRTAMEEKYKPEQDKLEEELNKYKSLVSGLRNKVEDLELELSSPVPLKKKKKSNVW